MKYQIENNLTIKNEITWGTKFPVGRYGTQGENISLYEVKIKDTECLKYCYENRLHLIYPEINFIFENISEKEFNEIMR